MNTHFPQIRPPGYFHDPNGLCPILFSLHMLPLDNVNREHSIKVRWYTDDTELFLYNKPGGASQFIDFKACLKNEKGFNFLLFNSD